MNDLKILLKKKLGHYFDLKAFLNSEKNGKKVATAIFASIFVLIYFVLAQMFLLDVYDLFLEKGAHKEIIIIAMAVYIFLLIVFYTPILIYKTYYSDDVKILLSLPIKAENILLSNLIFSSIAAMGYSILFTLPMLIKVGTYLNKGILFYLIALICIYLITMIILCIISFLSTFIMKYINRNDKYKKILRFASSMVLMIAMVALQIYIQFMIKDFAASQLVEKVSDFSGKVYISMPYLRLMVNALFSDSALTILINILLLALIAFTLLFINVKVSSKTMIQGILSAGTVKNKKKAKAEEIKNSSVIKEVFTKDVKDILSTPIFFMNKLMGGVIVLIMMFLPMFTGQTQNAEFQNFIGIIREYLNNFNLLTMGMLILIVMALTMFISGTSETASSTFTREGKNIWLMKTLPIKASDQINGRLLASIVICAISSLPIVLAIIYLLRPSLLAIAVILIVFIVSIVFISSICMIPGILLVDTKWENPAKAIKGAKSLIPAAILFGMLLLIAFTVFASIGFDINNIGNGIFYAALTWLILMIVAIIVLNKYLRKLYSENLRKME